MKVYKALKGRADEVAEDIEFAVASWQAGDARMGATVSEALAASGYAVLAARVGALLEGRPLPGACSVTPHHLLGKGQGRKCVLR